MTAVILEPKKIKSVTASTFFPYMCHEVMGPDAMIIVFRGLGFKPAFSLSSFTFIKRLFSSACFLPQWWCHLHISGDWYFSQQSWFQLVLHPAWYFTWCILHMSQISRVTIYSLDVLLSQFWTSQLLHVQFQLLVLDAQVFQESGKAVWYSHACTQPFFGLMKLRR